MNNQEFHNPQEVCARDLHQQAHKNDDNVYRFLTVEEIAVLSDPEQDFNFALSVFNRLKPEILLNSKLWNEVPELVRDGFILSATCTYRTSAPLKIFNEVSNFFKTSNGNERLFITGFKHLASIHNSRMVEKGFWDDRNEIEVMAFAHSDALGEAAENLVSTAALALITTETSETVEALRHGNGPDDKIPHHCGAAAELADVILRIMDLAHARKWDVSQALVDKMSMNQGREKLHGKKF